MRAVLVAVAGAEIRGYGTVCWEPDYPPFVAAGIPEIQDLNVLPRFRRRGIASAMLDHAEAMAAERSATVAIITTASLVAPLAGSLGLDTSVGRVFLVLAIGAGISDGLGFGANTRVALITPAVTELRIACGFPMRRRRTTYLTKSEKTA